MFLFILSDAARKVSRCVGVVPTDVLWQDGLQELPPYPKNLHNIIDRVWKSSTCLEAAKLKQVTKVPLTSQRDRDSIMPE